MKNNLSASAFIETTEHFCERYRLDHKGYRYFQDYMRRTDSVFAMVENYLQYSSSGKAREILDRIDLYRAEVKGKPNPEAAKPEGE